MLFLKISGALDCCLHIFVEICLLNANVFSESSCYLKKLNLVNMRAYAKALQQSGCFAKYFLVSEQSLQELTVSSEISFKLKNKHKIAMVTIYHQTLANTSLLRLQFTKENLIMDIFSFFPLNSMVYFYPQFLT